MGFTEPVPRHKIKVNKASNISDFMIKCLECYDTPSVAGMVRLGIGSSVHTYSSACSIVAFQNWICERCLSIPEAIDPT